MKITDVKIHHIEWERGPYHWRDEIMPSGATARTALLRILTDEGIEGLSGYSAGASVDFRLKYGYPATINDADLTVRMIPTLEKVSGDQPLNMIQPQTVAEDFSFFANETPGLYVFLGSGVPGVDPLTLPSNHSPLFDMHEPSMELGVRTFSHLVVDYLNSVSGNHR